MMTGQRSGAILIHPQGAYTGNILWPGTLPAEHLAALPAALARVTAQGFFASPFPEGDGITFRRKDEAAYDPEASLGAFRAAFPFLDIEVINGRGDQNRALARLAGDRTITCRYLAPVEALRLEAPFDLGETSFHAPVDGADNRLADHRWRELCDIPGADMDPDWAPEVDVGGTTELLGHPLIERSIEVPLATFYEANESIGGLTRLLRLLMEDADHALDPVRFGLCHYRRLEFLPAKPGWLEEFALVYVMPESRSLKPRILGGKPYVLRVSNNWLGLDLDKSILSGLSGWLADIVDSKASDEITLALKSALRALNRAFYLVELEASFLHLIYATDALCEPGRLTGDHHRIWITAFASGGDATRFASLLDRFKQHYLVRNDIVHGGKTFASLGLTGEEQCQFMLELLGSCITTFFLQGFADRSTAAQFAFDTLTSPAITPLLTAMASRRLKLPLTDDPVFKNHMLP